MNLYFCESDLFCSPVGCLEIQPQSHFLGSLPSLWITQDCRVSGGQEPGVLAGSLLAHDLGGCFSSGLCWGSALGSTLISWTLL